MTSVNIQQCTKVFTAALTTIIDCRVEESWGIYWCRNLIFREGTHIYVLEGSLSSFYRKLRIMCSGHFGTPKFGNLYSLIESLCFVTFHLCIQASKFTLCQELAYLLYLWSSESCHLRNDIVASILSTANFIYNIHVLCETQYKQFI